MPRCSGACALTKIVEQSDRKMAAERGTRNDVDKICSPDKGVLWLAVRRLFVCDLIDCLRTMSSDQQHSRKSLDGEDAAAQVLNTEDVAG
jgi:hypothetical protein